jgi:hypothetical protein
MECGIRAVFLERQPARDVSGRKASFRGNIDVGHSNLAGNLPVTFTIGVPDSSNSNATTDIILPYRAFDFVATFPLADIRNATGQQRYFPLRRAEDLTQQYLGRTFLQSA